MTLRRTPLYDRHVGLAAKTADFGGWDMPIEYSGSGTVAEHTAVRTDAGIFDVSHMGKVAVKGTGAAEAVNAIVTNDIGRLQPGQAQYSMVLNESGGVVDDLIVYLVGADEVFIVPNAANAAKVVSALSQGLPEGVVLDDQHDALGILAVQGPRSTEVLAALGLPTGHDYMSFVDAPYAETTVRVCRTGYTGEVGYELLAPSADLGGLWDAVVAQGVRPAGLGARDTLRTEMGYPLHGQDLSESISPVQARLAWAIGWDKPEFIGRAAVVSERASGPARRLWGITLQDRGIPRSHMPVMQGDDVVGETTSGTFSPTLKQGIALALLDTAVGEGAAVEVDVRGRRLAGTVVKPPFVAASTR